MSSSNQQSSSPPVVQMVLESFTRCFNPLEHSGCAKSEKPNPSNKNNVGDGSSSSNSSRNPISPTSSQLFGLNIGSGTEGVASTLARAVSRSSSSSDSRKQKLHPDVSYDADGVSMAKKSHQRMLSKEQLEERSMKRKLEIFRGSGQEGSRPPPPKIQPRQQLSRQSPPPPSVSRQGSPNTPTGGQHNNIKSVTGADLALSDDEEELIRLTQSRKRFACGMNMDRITRDNSPISSVARLFNFGISEAQKPFGLCFATPVRTASQEDIANLSDDKLTDDEFLRRHCPEDAAGGNNNSAAMVSPDAAGGDQSYCEEETISSTLYFDQKYSHVVQTRPPMPLFQENMLHCTETKFDEITNVIKGQRSSSNDNNNGQDHPPLEVISKGRRSPRSRVQGRGSPFRRNTGNDGRSSSKGTGRVPSPPIKGGEENPPSPIRIRDESLSVNTQSAEEEMIVLTTSGSGNGVQMKLREPCCSRNPATSAEI